VHSPEAIERTAPISRRRRQRSAKRRKGLTTASSAPAVISGIDAQVNVSGDRRKVFRARPSGKGPNVGTWHLQTWLQRVGDKTCRKCGYSRTQTGRELEGLAKGASMYQGVPSSTGGHLHASPSNVVHGPAVGGGASLRQRLEIGSEHADIIRRPKQQSLDLVAAPAPTRAARGAARRLAQRPNARATDEGKRTGHAHSSAHLPATGTCSRCSRGAPAGAKASFGPHFEARRNPRTCAGKELGHRQSAPDWVRQRRISRPRKRAVHQARRPIGRAPPTNLYPEDHVTGKPWATVTHPTSTICSSGPGAEHRRALLQLRSWRTRLAGRTRGAAVAGLTRQAGAQYPRPRLAGRRSRKSPMRCARSTTTRATPRRKGPTATAAVEGNGALPHPTPISNWGAVTYSPCSFRGSAIPAKGRGLGLVQA